MERKGWRPTILALALFGTALGVAACSTTPTGSSTASSNQTTQATGTTTSTAAGGGTESVTAVCSDVASSRATLDRTKVLPADEAQKILADSQSSGSAKLESEASTLASASHVLDQAGISAALTAMVATCHELTAKP